MSRDEEQEILDRARRREELERRGYTRRKCDTCRGFGVYADGCECLSCDGKGYRWYAPITKYSHPQAMFKMSTKKEDDSTVKTWRCKHCGHDEHWFDRTVMVWQDKKGKFHEDGPCYRCRKCGKEDV